MKLLGLVVLVFNLALGSIPRCNLIIDFLVQSSLTETPASSPSPSCHESTTPKKNERLPAWTSHPLCQCSLLQYLSFVLPSFELNSLMTLQTQGGRLLVFDLEDHSASLILSPDPPYPKALTSFHNI